MESFKSFLESYSDELDSLSEMAGAYKATGKNAKHRIIFNQDDRKAIMDVLKALTKASAQHNYKVTPDDQIDALRQLFLKRYSRDTLDPRMTGRDPLPMQFKLYASNLGQLYRELHQPKYVRKKPKQNFIYDASVHVNAEELRERFKNTGMDLDAFLSGWWRGMNDATAQRLANKAVAWIKGKGEAPVFNVDPKHIPKKAKNLAKPEQTRRFQGGGELETKSLAEMPMDEQDQKYFDYFNDRRIKKYLKNNGITPEPGLIKLVKAQALAQRYSDQFVGKKRSGRFAPRKGFSRRGSVFIKIRKQIIEFPKAPINGKHLAAKYAELQKSMGVDYVGDKKHVGQRLWNRDEGWATRGSIETAKGWLENGYRPAWASKGHEFAYDKKKVEEAERLQQRYIEGKGKSPNIPENGEETPKKSWRYLVMSDVRTGIKRAIRQLFRHNKGDWSAQFKKDSPDHDVIEKTADEQVYMGMSRSEKYYDQAARIAHATTIAYQEMEKIISRGLEQRTDLDAPVGGEEGKTTSRGASIVGHAPSPVASAGSADMDMLDILPATPTPEAINSLINFLWSSQQLDRQGDKLVFAGQSFDKEHLRLMMTNPEVYQRVKKSMQQHITAKSNRMANLA